MRALSVKQPFAELIARGTKKIEYRTWSVNFRGDLLIVASKGRNDERCEDEGLDPRTLAYGVAVCVVEVVGVSGGEGDFEWKLKNPRRVEPVAVRGFAAIYNVPDENIRFVGGENAAATSNASAEDAAPRGDDQADADDDAAEDEDQDENLGDEDEDLGDLDDADKDRDEKAEDEEDDEEGEDDRQVATAGDAHEHEQGAPVVHSAERAATARDGRVRVLLAAGGSNAAQAFSTIVDALGTADGIQHEGDGREALRVLQTVGADLLVLSMFMTRKSGLEVLEDIHASGMPKPKIVRLEPSPLGTGGQPVLDLDDRTRSVATIRRALGMSAGEIAHARAQWRNRRDGAKEVLAALDGPTLNRVCGQLGLAPRRAIEDRRKAIVGEVGADLERLLSTLTKLELVTIVESHDGIVDGVTYSGGRVRRTPKDDLIDGLVDLYANGRVPPFFEARASSSGTPARSAPARSGTFRSERPVAMRDALPAVMLDGGVCESPAPAACGAATRRTASGAH